MAEEDPWGFDEAGDQPESDVPAIAPGAEEPGLQPPPVPEPVEASDEDHAPPIDDHYRKPVTLYRHWVR